MAETESQQVSVGLPAALTQAVVPLAYDSLQADLQKQQPPEEVPGSGGVQLQEVPFQAWPQGRTYQQPAPVVGVSPQQGPVQYIAAPPVGGPGYQFPTSVTAAPIPPYKGPHDFLTLAIITTIILAFLNLCSLGFGIPAIIFSALSKIANCNKEYFKAKTYGKYSLTMTVLNILFTLCLALLITAATMGCAYLDSFRYGRISYPGCRH